MKDRMNVFSCFLVSRAFVFIMYYYCFRVNPWMQFNTIPAIITSCTIMMSTGCNPIVIMKGGKLMHRVIDYLLTTLFLFFFIHRK